ncbi:hypothetical protein DXG01_010882 [Tephrocybe rancida]|nr:hypothetical protein DXG01_010882 [Tephrocybe rancida]
MEYPQWIVIVISNSSTRKLVVKNVRLDWGKFHKDNNKDAEISIGDVEGKEVDAGQQYKINSCGRLSSPTGTEGGLDVYEVDGDKVCHLYWSCPWGGSRNEWRVSGMKISFFINPVN